MNRATTWTAARQRAIKTDVVENLARSNLSIGEIAARHGLTPRYVQMLFESEGATFTEFLLDPRLAQTYRMLTDVRFAERSITSVAFDAGFSDLSYFDRVFRRRYGVPRRPTCVPTTSWQLRSRPRKASRCPGSPPRYFRNGNGWRRGVKSSAGRWSVSISSH
jgi:AraC-like DNA-binding protein